MTKRRLIIAVVLACFVLPVEAQTGRLETIGESPETVEMRRRLLGALLYPRVTVRVVDVPVREAVDALRPQIPAPLVVRFADDPVGYGIDPRKRITLDHADEVALTVLEDLLDQCTADQPCTWQLRRGFIELGTRDRLSVPVARERRLYPIRHLMIDVPDFVNHYIPGSARGEAPRKHPAQVAVELVETIVESIETDLWDWGQLDEEAPPARNAPLDPGATPAMRNERPTPRYAPARRAAVIRYWRDVLIVDAPDFMHRQINGDPAPIPPSLDATTPGFVWTVGESDRRWRGSETPRAWERPVPDDASP